MSDRDDIFGAESIAWMVASELVSLGVPLRDIWVARTLGGDATLLVDGCSPRRLSSGTRCRVGQEARDVIAEYQSARRRDAPAKEENMIRMHPREQNTRQAERDVEDAVRAAIDRYELTEGEQIQVATSVMSSWILRRAKYMIRVERHGDVNKPGGVE